MFRQVADTMNWDYYESVDRFQRILDAHGITEALKENGAKEGDLVMIGACVIDCALFVVFLFLYKYTQIVHPLCQASGTSRTTTSGTSGSRSSVSTTSSLGGGTACPTVIRETRLCCCCLLFVHVCLSACSCMCFFSVVLSCKTHTHLLSAAAAAEAVPTRRTKFW
jgi:Obg family GTPase CgtA-like protein